MKRITSLLIALILSASAWALAPEIEVDRLLLQAKSALDAKDYALATESLMKAEKLSVKLPDTFYYHYGRAHAGNGKFEQGRDMLEKYLTLSGTKGKFYQEALVEINNIEASIKKRDADRDAAIKERAEKLNAVKQAYKNSLAAYKQDVSDCPAKYYEYLEDARKRLRRAENDCVKSLCDMHEQKNDYYADKMATLERRNARKDVEKYTNTSAGNWCSDRYTEPSFPDALR